MPICHVTRAPLVSVVTDRVLRMDATGNCTTVSAHNAEPVEAIRSRSETRGMRIIGYPLGIPTTRDKGIHHSRIFVMVSAWIPGYLRPQAVRPGGARTCLKAIGSVSCP